MKGLDTASISRLVEFPVREYFADCSLEDADGLLCECVTLHFEEIRHAIPENLRPMFPSDSWYRCYSGGIEFPSRLEEHEGKEYIVIAVTDEQGENLLLIFLQEVDISDGADRTILLKSYIPTGPLP